MGGTEETLFSMTQIVDPSTILSQEEIRRENVLLKNIFTGCATALQGIIWCARRRLLGNSSSCGNCNIPMSCTKRAKLIVDGYVWSCKKCPKLVTIRKNSFFEKSKLSLEQILILIHGWAEELPQDYIARLARIEGNHTILYWFNLCREVCEKYFIMNSITVGGLNEDGTSKIVECKFFHRKYHCGRWIDDNWVFGGIERGTKKCFLVEVPNKTEATYSALIERYILPGSIIVSDGWRSYGSIHNIGGGLYEHQVNIHEENIVDPNDNCIHTQNVRNMWMRAKKKLRRQFVSSEAMLQSYLHDFVWKNQFSKIQVFSEFLNAVVAQYPVK
ncbi:uncharacterized protein LOC123675881 isoform X2 [Harmonia axyridis]|uniref:uncharacterized protein LOC123675881 isoform X2 n=1 Tax=Harmonia axyridis TaxID=115357 RepID=UPI001E274F71|nr:uncharacterized protein LOC123675881 isoform X2 [Harmonia axyridis]